MKQSLQTRLASAILLLAPALLYRGVQAAPVADIPDPRFGVVEAHAAPDAAAAMGAGWTRITFEWARIQPNNADEWNAPISDEALANEINQGRQVVGLLVTTPAWATDPSIGGGVPRGLYLPADDPNNLWANFVRAIVARYAGRIDHWTIWNEPDIPSTSPDATWGGSVADYVQLLRVAYFAVKEANPNATIHLAGLSHWHNDLWFGWFLDAVAADPNAAAYGYYFDVATLHLYHTPAEIYEKIGLYYAQMHSRGIYKPIWLAETNAYLSRVSEDEQASFIFQAFSLAIAAGAERIAVYKMADAPTDSAADPEPFGLVQMDGSPRPAFTAYRTAVTYLAGFQSGSWDYRQDVAVVTIARGVKTTTVVWARTPQPQTAVIPARTTSALLVDTRGGARIINPERGYYLISLEGATGGMEGKPVMLVEDAPVYAQTARSPSEDEIGIEATPTPTPPPTPSPTPVPPPIPLATSALLAATTPLPLPSPTPPPTPTPRPLPTSDIPPGKPWLLIGALALVLGSAAAATGLRRPTHED